MTEATDGMRSSVVVLPYNATVQNTLKPQRLSNGLNACGVPAPVTLRDRVITDSVEMLGGARPVTGWCLVDVYREVTIQAEHGWWW